MDEDQTHAFAVETTAELEVLRHAVTFLMARVLVDNSAAGRARILTTFEEEVGEMDPLPVPVSPEATRFFEGVAAAMPARAARFTQSVRAVLAQYPPPEG